MLYVTEALNALVVSHHVTGLFQHTTPTPCYSSLPQREVKAVILPIYRVCCKLLMLQHALFSGKRKSKLDNSHQFTYFCSLFDLESASLDVSC